MLNAENGKWATVNTVSWLLVCFEWNSIAVVPYPIARAGGHMNIHFIRRSTGSGGVAPVSSFQKSCRSRIGRR